MKNIDHLTHERLRNVFGNQFELVNYAIKLAEHLILSGRSPYIHSDPQNLSTTILEIIESGRDRFQNITSEAAFIAEIESAISQYDDDSFDDEDDEDEEDFEETTETIQAV